MLLDNVKLVADGRLLEARDARAARRGRYPGAQPRPEPRRPARADRRQREGRAGAARGWSRTSASTSCAPTCAHVQDNAEESVRRVIDVLKDGEFDYEMDNGARDPRDDLASTPTGAARRSTSPAPARSSRPTSTRRRPSCKAAVLYVFRTLVDDDIPLNAGCLKPLEVIIPEGSMLNPRLPGGGRRRQRRDLAVRHRRALRRARRDGRVAGHDEQLHVRQRPLPVYETISGGSGAGPGFDGTDVVQTHMTNSRLTDPEVLEWRFPVRLDELRDPARQRRRGPVAGGDGAMRRVRFLEPMTAAILAGHRRMPPFGMAGGEPGDVGRNWVERADGSRAELSYADETAGGRGRRVRDRDAGRRRLREELRAACFLRVASRRLTFAASAAMPHRCAKINFLAIRAAYKMVAFSVVRVTRNAGNRQPRVPNVKIGSIQPQEQPDRRAHGGRHRPAVPQLCKRMGAGMAVSEMVASNSLLWGSREDACAAPTTRARSSRCRCRSPAPIRR